MSHARRILMSIVSLLAALALLVVVVPTSSAATMTGTYVTVICPVGQSPQGLWFSGGGYQGWATWHGSGNGSATFGMGVPTWSTVHLVTGCGGTPARWQNTYSGDLYISQTPVLRRTMDCYRLRTVVNTCGVG